MSYLQTYKTFCGEITDAPILALNLKQKLDDIDQRIYGEVFDGFCESRLKILIGMWEKGEAIVSFLGGVKKKFNFLELERLTGRSDSALKKWHDLYKKDPDRKQYIEEVARPKAKKWTQKALQEKEIKQIEILPDSLFSEKWFVEVGDIQTYQTNKKFDFIITDPPYPKEYLPLYKILAKRAKEWLKPNGLLIAMCGQSYLDKIYESMSSELTYYWTGCYLTPGQPTPLRQKQVNTSWKPILIYSLREYSGKTFGDVYESDLEDKDFHEWGQSVSGMYSLISQICLPNQSIFDPFCGAGTTGVAALMHGCLFQGIDIDPECINISERRLTKVEIEIRGLGWTKK